MKLTGRIRLPCRAQAVALGLGFAALTGLAAVPALAHESGAYQLRATFTAAGTYRVDVAIDFDHAATVELPATPHSAPADLSQQELDRQFGSFIGHFVDHAELAFDDRVMSYTWVDDAAFVVPTASGALRHQVSAGLGAPGKLLLRFSGPIPGGAQMFSFRSTLPGVGGFTLAARNEGDPSTDVQVVADGATSRAFVIADALVPPSRTRVFAQYLVLGFEHILPKGLDHILFVLGLFLLSREWKPLLWQVSAFTLAHTLTLGLSIYGVVSLPGSVVEPLIAASIVYVAIENVVSSRLHSWRVALVFAFGLLHGLGFAGVLTELGLPRNELLTGLLSFNIGVEIGQLTVILLAFVAVGLPFRDRAWYRSRVVVPASLAIAGVGLYWAVERTFFG